MSLIDSAYYSCLRSNLRQTKLLLMTALRLESRLLWSRYFSYCWTFFSNYSCVNSKRNMSMKSSWTSDMILSSISSSEIVCYCPPTLSLDIKKRNLLSRPLASSHFYNWLRIMLRLKSSSRVESPLETISKPIFSELAISMKSPEKYVDDSKLTRISRYSSLFSCFLRRVK